MAKKVFSVVFMLIMAASVCQSEASTGGYGSPTNSGAAESAPNYHFGYGVFDPQTGSDFMHEEERNNQATKGQYRVNLPDGRIQIVTYTADENGYRAEVTYQDAKSGGSVAASSQSSYSSLGASNAAVAASAPRPVAAPAPSRSNGRNYHRVRATVAGQQYQYGY